MCGQSRLANVRGGRRLVDRTSGTGTEEVVMSGDCLMLLGGCGRGPASPYWGCCGGSGRAPVRSCPSSIMMMCDLREVGITAEKTAEEVQLFRRFCPSSELFQQLLLFKEISKSLNLPAMEGPEPFQLVPFQDFSSN